MGADVRLFNPQGLPLFDNNQSANHPKVIQIREKVQWSEAQVWSFPEIHGNMSGVMKTQIDWIPTFHRRGSSHSGQGAGREASHRWLSEF